MDDVNSARPRDFDTEAVHTIVGYRLRRAQVLVFQQFIARFAEFALAPAEYSVLALIEANPGSKQTEIGEALGIKRANFVTLIDGLEQRGLTERRKPSGDRRANALYLTAAGEALIARANAVQVEFEAEIVERLGGPNARDQLLTLLDKLVDHG